MPSLTSTETEALIDFHLSMLSLIKEKQRYTTSIQHILNFDPTHSDTFKMWLHIARESYRAIQKITDHFSMQQDEHQNAIIEIISALSGDQTPDDFLPSDNSETAHLSIRQKTSGWGPLHKIAFYSPAFLKYIFLLAKSSERLQRKIATIIKNDTHHTWTFWHEMNLFASDQVQHFHALSQSCPLIAEAAKAYAVIEKNIPKSHVYQNLYYALHQFPMQLEEAKRDHNECGYLVGILRETNEENWTLLHILARYAPNHLEQLLDFAKTNERIQMALSQIMRIQNQHGWTILHLIPQFCPRLLPHFFALFSKSPHMKIGLMHALPLQNENGDTILHLLLQHACDPLSALFKESQLDKLSQTDFSHLSESLYLMNTYSKQTQLSDCAEYIEPSEVMCAKPYELSDFMSFIKAHSDVQTLLAATLIMKNKKGYNGFLAMAMYAPDQLSACFEIALQSHPLQNAIINNLMMPDDTHSIWLHLLATSSYSDTLRKFFQLGIHNPEFQKALMGALSCKGNSALISMGKYALDDLSALFAYAEKNYSYEVQLSHLLTFNTKSDWPVLQLTARYRPNLLDPFIKTFSENDERQHAFLEALPICNKFNVNVFLLLTRYAPKQLGALIHLAKSNEAILRSIEKGAIAKKIISMTPSLIDHYFILVNKSNDLHKELSDALPIQDAENWSILHTLICRATTAVFFLFNTAEKNAYMRKKIAEAITLTDDEKYTALLKLLMHAPEHSLDCLFKWACSDKFVRAALLKALPIKNEREHSAITELVQQDNAYFARYIPMLFDLMGRVKTHEIDESLKKAFLAYAPLLKDKLSLYISTNQFEPELFLLVDKTTLLGALIDECDKTSLTARATSALTSITSFFSITRFSNVEIFNTLRSQSDKLQNYFHLDNLGIDTTSDDFALWRLLKHYPFSQLSEPFTNNQVITKLAIQNSVGTTVLHVMICLSHTRLPELFELTKTHVQMQKLLLSTFFMTNRRNASAFSLLCHYAEKMLPQFFDWLGHIDANDIDLRTKQFFLQYDCLLSHSLTQFLTHIKKDQGLLKLTDKTTLLGWLIDQYSCAETPFRQSIDQYSTKQKEVIDAFMRAQNPGIFLRRIAKDDPESLSILLACFKRDLSLQHHLTNHLIFKPEKSSSLLTRLILYCPNNLEPIFDMCVTSAPLLDIIINALSSPDGSNTLITLSDYGLQHLIPLLKLSDTHDALFTAIKNALQNAADERPNLMRMIIKHAKKRIPAFMALAGECERIKSLMVCAMPIQDDFRATGLQEIICASPAELSGFFKTIESRPDWIKYVINSLYTRDAQDHYPIAILLANHETYRAAIYNLFRLFGKISGTEIHDSVKNNLLADKANLLKMLHEFLQFNKRNLELRVMTDSPQLLGLLIDHQRGISSTIGTRRLVNDLLAHQVSANNTSAAAISANQSVSNFVVLDDCNYT